MATSWFSYTSGTITAPTSYTIVGSQPLCDFPKEIICGIFAEIQLLSGVQRPVITTTLQTAITTAFNTKVESSNVRLKPQV